MNETRRILIVDGNNACWRLMKRLPELSVGEKPVQVVYGFVRLLRGVLSQFEPNAALVCWDSGRSRFRQKTYSDYKTNRQHNDEAEYASCLAQMGCLQDDILPLLNIAQSLHPGTEADDLIGLACTVLGGVKIVVSSDQDMLQLVNKDVQVWSPIKSVLYTHSNFVKGDNFVDGIGLTPRQYLQLRALTGDGADNISGVAKGFGEHTAKELLLKYGSIENLYTASVEKTVMKKGNRYALLYSDGARETAYRNLLMMDLLICAQHIENRDEVIYSMKRAVNNGKKIDRAKVKNLFIEKRFKSLLDDFGSWITPFECLDMEQAQR